MSEVQYVRDTGTCIELCRSETLHSWSCLALSRPDLLPGSSWPAYIPTSLAHITRSNVSSMRKWISVLIFVCLCMFLPLCFGLCCCLLCAAFGVIKNNNITASESRANISQDVLWAWGYKNEIKALTQQQCGVNSSSRALSLRWQLRERKSLKVYHMPPKLVTYIHKSFIKMMAKRIKLTIRYTIKSI